jgi:hypothetical protein
MRKIFDFGFYFNFDKSEGLVFFKEFFKAGMVKNPKSHNFSWKNPLLLSEIFILLQSY